MKKTNESGRSMVEMLGVLAVIGVLSVAGIAGYSNAMKKYKANELLNEASKRATVVAMQIASGKAPNISEFGNNTVQGVSITADEYTAGAKTFSFSLAGSGLNDICSKLSEAVGDNSFMKVESECAKITFNADLSRGESEQQPITTPSSCPTGETQNFDGTCSNDKCTDNSNCSSGKYCKVSVISAGKNYNNDCSAGDGICESIGTIETLGDYLSTEEYMNWDSAKNWCAALSGNHPMAKLSAVQAIMDKGAPTMYVTMGGGVEGRAFWLDPIDKSDSCQAWYAFPLPEDEFCASDSRNADGNDGTAAHPLCE